MKKPTITKLKKKLDALFSQYIRIKYSDENGIGECYTCGVKKHYKKLQNGHYIPRRHLATRWLEDNCRIQCMACNVFKKGNYDEYSLKLINEFGQEHLVKLNKLKYETVILKIADYEDMIVDMQSRLNQI